MNVTDFPRNVATRMEVGANDVYPMVDLHRVPWPQTPEYGAQHGINTARLSMVVLSYIHTPLDVERKSLWLAALFHDLGRQESWRAADELHNERSARIAEDVLRGDFNTWADDMVRDMACKLIAQHDTRRTPEQVRGHGPLACALHDADCMEAARIAPMTNTGADHYRARTDPRRLCTPFAQSADNRKRWLKFRWEQK